MKRVNLIVGENNSGKTSLLEAILLLCDPGRTGEMPGLFRAQQGNDDQRYFRWLLRDGAEKGCGFLRSKTDKGEFALILSSAASQGWLAKGAGEKTFRSVCKRSTLHIWGEMDAAPQKTSCRVISVQQTAPNLLVPLVGKAFRKGGGEETLQRLLSAVDPRIKKMHVDPGEDGNQVIVDAGLSELIPVSQAGQGVYRQITILADLVGENPDVLLLDEVENGLHHSVHQQVWKGLGEAAEQLKIQIFATTHSGECLKAAHAAFASRKNYDFSVIQLFRVSAGIQGKVLDRELIDAAISGKIDLR